MAKLIALDFESAAIEDRPNFPPEPCGIAVYDPAVEPFYYAWGHPTGNNCTRERALMEIAEYIENPDFEFVFHNAPFDCAILQDKFKLKVPWERVHDTMLLAFLANPFGELSLKPLCEELLGMPPSERDAVRDWLVFHGVCRANDKGWGAHISKAPGDLVGEYAKGDVVRTYKLYEYFMKGGDGSALSHLKPNPVDTSKVRV
jgi:DNA polymerase III epsilon subunit-like protein